jgi:hypothetical protein
MTLKKGITGNEQGTKETFSLRQNLSKFSFYWVYAIAFFTINTVLIVFCFIGKHGLDLYPVFATLWALSNVVMVLYATSIKRYVLFIFLITVFDGFIDGFAQHAVGTCGDIKWLPPPWALPWDFTTYSYSSPLTTAYIYLMWFGLVTMRFIALTYYFVDYYTKNKISPKIFNPSNKLQSILILAIALLFIELFYIADHFNFLIRGYLPTVGIIPDIDWTVSLGFIQLSLLHLFILVITGSIIMALCFISTVKSYSYIAFIFGLFILERVIVPYIYAITAGPYLALSILIATIIIGAVLLKKKLKEFSMK